MEAAIPEELASTRVTEGATGLIVEETSTAMKPATSESSQQAITEAEENAISHEETSFEDSTGTEKRERPLQEGSDSEEQEIKRRHFAADGNVDTSPNELVTKDKEDEDQRAHLKRMPNDTGDFGKANNADIHDIKRVRRDRKRKTPETPVRASSRVRRRTQRLIEIYLGEHDYVARVEEIFGTNPFSYNKAMNCGLPSNIFEEALTRELQVWNGAYEEVDVSQIPSGANVIGCHVLFNVKPAAGNKQRRLKARLVLHGHRDKERSMVRGDAPVPNSNAQRLVASICAAMGWQAFNGDVEGAYMKSGPAPRLIFVRLPPFLEARRRTLWKLLKMPYGLRDAGRQWLKCSDGELRNMGLRQSLFFPQIFFSPSRNLLLAKYVDDIFGCGTKEAVTAFLVQFEKRFKLGTRVLAPESMRFVGWNVETSSDRITLNQRDYAAEIEALEVPKDKAAVVDKDHKDYLKLCGKLNWLGHRTSPVAAFAASFLLQRAAHLSVHDLRLANGVLKECKRQPNCLSFKKVLNRPCRGKDFAHMWEKAVIEVFTDAGFPHGKELPHAQLGIAIGLTWKSRISVSHLVDWESRRMRKVVYSTPHAELLAITQGYAAAKLIQAFFYEFAQVKVPIHAFTDSKGMQANLTTSSCDIEKFLRLDAALIRHELETGELQQLTWIRGNRNPADCLTKRVTGTGQVILRNWIEESALSHFQESGTKGGRVETVTATPIMADAGDAGALAAAAPQDVPRGAHEVPARTAERENAAYQPNSEQAKTGKAKETKAKEPRVGSFWTRSEAFFSNQGANLATLALLIALDICMATWGVWEFTAPHWTTESKILRYTLPIARGAGRLVSWNAAVVFVTGSKWFWTWVRSTPIQYAFPVDKVMPKYHRLIALTIVIAGCVIHTVPQVVNYATEAIVINDGGPVWTFGAGFATLQLLITGILLLVVFLLFFATTLEKVRRSTIGFRIFWLSHVIGIVSAIPLLIIHGTQRGYPITVYFLAGPLVLYIIDVIMRRVRHAAREATVVHISAHEDGEDRVTKLILQVPGWRYSAGQYADIRIKEISVWEWHAFTIASAPNDRGEATFFIKAAGRWTGALWELANSATATDAESGSTAGIVGASLRGGFGAPAQKFSAYRHIVVIGTGIGVTPLLSVWHHIVDETRILMRDESLQDADGLSSSGSERTWNAPEVPELPLTEEEQFVLDHGDMAFTDVLGFERVSRATMTTRARVAFAASILESMTVNICLFLISIMLVTLVMCVWIFGKSLESAAIEIVASLLVLFIYVPKVILSGASYGKRYIVSIIFVMELAIVAMTVASLAASIADAISPSLLNAVLYFSFYGVYTLVHTVRIFFIYYATARPPELLEAENVRHTKLYAVPSRQSNEGSTLSVDPLDDDFSMQGIWVNKTYTGMSWAAEDLAESAKSLPRSFSLQFYATRDKPETLVRLDPFDRSRCGPQHELIAGRPDWHKIMSAAILRAHRGSPNHGSTVGVFYCGAPAVARELQSVAHRVTAEHLFEVKRQMLRDNRIQICTCRVLVAKENF
ncbi:Respiratory burst oxidase-like protein C [Porphyridium purpureum]|uniref:Respiratory burst oxidase-like protein C n=1 Tax=Porphyridium purpureum TaxID=35688 RepID=A0A5J4YWM9_PORPP|nr:Respiratory burst oxidase-like protein C [Porphyridium purpureum]|eukprot:POR2201..scf209_3